MGVQSGLNVLTLVTSDRACHAIAVTNKVDISKLSMKFFTEKRLYSQHFHSLRLRSSKQDLAFKGTYSMMRVTPKLQYHHFAVACQTLLDTSKLLKHSMRATRSRSSGCVAPPSTAIPWRPRPRSMRPGVRFASLWAIRYWADCASLRVDCV